MLDTEKVAHVPNALHREVDVIKVYILKARQSILKYSAGAIGSMERVTYGGHFSSSIHAGAKYGLMEELKQG